MRGTGRFEIHEASITFNKWNHPVSFVFFGDVHKFAPNHADDVWKEFLEKHKNRPDTYFFGMGDYLDLMSASERASWRKGEWHESTEETLEKFYVKRVAEFCEDIKFMRGRLIGMLEGNHFLRFPDGTTTAMRMCQDLGARYLGDCAVVRTHFRSSSKNNISLKMDMVLHSGIGGGRTTGASFNSLDQMANAFEGASIYAMGDNHQRGGVPTQRLYLSDNHHGEGKIKDRQILLLRTGAFLKGFVPGKASYVVDAMMRPSNLGAIRVDVTPRRRRYGPHGRDGDESWFDLEVIA